MNRKAGEKTLFGLLIFSVCLWQNGGSDILYLSTTAAVSRLRGMIHYEYNK
jgi:hypothetical protein